MMALDPLLLGHSYEYQHLTYRERMDRMIGAFTICKDRIGTLLKHGMGAIEAFLLAPENLVKSSEANRVANDRRQEQLVTGRQVEKQAKEEHELEAST